MILVSLIGFGRLIGFLLSLRKDMSLMFSVVMKKDADCCGTFIEEKLVFGLSDSDLISTHSLTSMV
jgi:hypothetical protein